VFSIYVKMDYYCYLLYSTSIGMTYIGITNDLDKRLKKHNGILNGGAKATRKASDWEYRAQILFTEKTLALSFEWYAKHKTNINDKWVKTKGLDERLKRIDELLADDKFNTAKKIM